MTANSAMTASESTATTSAKRKESSAPAMFSSRKIAYRMSHHTQAGIDRPNSSSVMPSAYEAEK
jgi:hypothetical protein